MSMIDEAEGRRIAGIPKTALDKLEWTARQNHSGSQICVSVLADHNGITIPGLTVTLEAKAPIVVDACLYLFTVSKLTHGKKLRAYQLEVIPTAKRGHNGKSGAIYGPHEHFGEEAFAVTDSSVGCGDWASCYAWFLNRCNLTAPIIDAPC